MKTKPPFEMDDDMGTKLTKLENKIRYWVNKKYDLFGIDLDEQQKGQLFDVEMAIFMNQFIWRTMYWDKPHSTVESAMSGSQEESKNKEKKNEDPFQFIKLGH
jgi:hypothetical protein